MNKDSVKEIEVYAHWVGMNEPVQMGILHATPSRGKEIFAFDYDISWIKHPIRAQLDPSLQLISGYQYAPQSQCR